MTEARPQAKTMRRPRLTATARCGSSRRTPFARDAIIRIAFHSRGSGNPDLANENARNSIWIPASAGMTAQCFRNNESGAGGLTATQHALIAPLRHRSNLRFSDANVQRLRRLGGVSRAGVADACCKIAICSLGAIGSNLRGGGDVALAR